MIVLIEKDDKNMIEYQQTYKTWTIYNNYERKCSPMPALQLQPEPITLKQYEALPEEKRLEVFDGIAYDLASPSRIHQSISMQLSTVINNYILRKKGTCSIFSAPFDVKLSDNPLTIVQPDLMVICDQDKLDQKRCNGAPDFIIEIM